MNIKLVDHQTFFLNFRLFIHLVLLVKNFKDNLLLSPASLTVTWPFINV